MKHICIKVIFASIFIILLKYNAAFCVSFEESDKIYSKQADYQMEYEQKQKGWVEELNRQQEVINRGLYGPVSYSIDPKNREDAIKSLVYPYALISIGISLLCFIIGLYFGLSFSILLGLALVLFIIPLALDSIWTIFFNKYHGPSVLYYIIQTLTAIYFLLREYPKDPRC